ncbi:helix-turn-helix domain-containing protein [Acinetobacter puyangensis]|uniref:helix-turn-helix domain-containing protein n=1 Tax=Acinetobacter puyangensis TaxID=1096779 RepID=UPI003A4D33A6
MNSILIYQAEKLLDELPEVNSFDERIQATIIEAIHERNICINNIAKKLGLSTRILQNKLQQQNRTFKQYLMQVRKERALLYLRDSSLSISDIAELLVYNE